MIVGIEMPKATKQMSLDAVAIELKPKALTKKEKKAIYNKKYNKEHKKKLKTRREAHKAEAVLRTKAWCEKHLGERKEWVKSNKTKVVGYDKKWRKAHPEEVVASEKKCRENHKPERAAYKEDHKVEIAAYNKKYGKDHKAELATYAKVYADEHKAEIVAYRKIYNEINKAEIAANAKKYYKAWCKTPKGKESAQRQHAKRKGFGTEQLNAWFQGCEGHHVTKDLIMNIPKALHRSVPHAVVSGKNMQAVNALAIDFLLNGF